MKSFYPKNKNCKFRKVTVGSKSYLIGNRPQKFIAPHSMGSTRL